MGDFFNLAFDTIIVGGFSFLWVLVILDTIFFINGKSLWDKTKNSFPKGKDALSALVLGLPLLVVMYVSGLFMVRVSDTCYDIVSGIIPYIQPDDRIKSNIYSELEKPYKLIEAIEYVKDEDTRKELERVIDNIKDEGTDINIREKLEKVISGTTDKRLRDALDEGIGWIYSEEKYYIFANSEDAHNTLNYIKRKINVLRGVMTSGVFLFFTTLICILMLSFVKYKRKQDRSLENLKMKMKVYLGSLAIGLILFIIGAFGTQNEENEYDEHVIGLYHGILSNHHNNESVTKRIDKE